jgi:hypothetical protein
MKSLKTRRAEAAEVKKETEEFGILYTIVLAFAAGAIAYIQIGI